MPPFLPIRAYNRSSSVRINGQKISPNTTYWADLGATSTSNQPVIKELAYHAAIGQIFPVGPLTYTSGSGLFVRSTLAAGIVVAAPANVETLALKVSIPASFLAVGSVVVIGARGTINGTASGLLGTVRLGTAGAVGDAQVCAAPNTGSVGSATPWTFDAEVDVQAIGAGTAASVVGNARLAVGTNLLGQSSQSAAVTFDSTVAQFIDLTFTGNNAASALAVNNASIRVYQ